MLIYPGSHNETSTITLKTPVQDKRVVETVPLKGDVFVGINRSNEIVSLEVVPK